MFDLFLLLKLSVERKLAQELQAKTSLNDTPIFDFLKLSVKEDEYRKH